MAAFIPKPAENIPDDEWQALPLEQQAFAEFIYDVLDYFEKVVREKLGWAPENLRINQGRNNVVIGFEANDQAYLFRVPKYGPTQLARHQRAMQQFGHFAFVTEQVYHDQQCMIEHFVPGNNLNREAPEAAYIELAKALNYIHAQSAQGFGPISSDNRLTGIHRNAMEHYLPPLTDMIQTLMAQLPEKADVLQQVFQQWQLTLRNSDSSAVVLCHGDLWSDNVIYDTESGSLKLIDWDTFGVYHREKDLHFLLSDDVPESYKQVFFQHYKYQTDPILMSWYRLTMNIVYYIPERYDHLAEAANHFLTLLGHSDRLTDSLSSSSEQGQ